jgi:hypothetical protein
MYLQLSNKNTSIKTIHQQKTGRGDLRYHVKDIRSY